MQLVGSMQWMLSNTLLKAAFNSCKDAVGMLLATAKFLALTTDG